MRHFVLFLILFPFFELGAMDRVPGEWLVVPRDHRGNAEPYLIRSVRKPKLSREYWVQPNFIYRANAADPDLVKSWGLINTGQTFAVDGTGIPGKDIGAETAWALSAGAERVMVAVLDSGSDFSHPDLQGRFWTNPQEIPGNGIDDDGNGFSDDEWGWNFIGRNTDNKDDNGHGTFCAGIIAATPENGVGTRGVAPGARVLTVKMLDKLGQGTSADAISAIDYAVKLGARVINASWGGTQFDAALYDAVRRAGDKGVLFVAAAGNDGRNNDHDAKPIYPASFRLPNIISVAAYDPRDGLAKFSNYGKETVQLGAPGVSIYSTTPGGYRFGEGTSFAAPFVTGVAALVMGMVPGISVSSLRDRLLWTSEPMHYYERERNETGGRVHAGNAVRNFRPVRPQTPTQWKKFSSNSSTTHPYPNKWTETYRFSQPGATHVRAHFQKFETESCCDKVVLKDGQGRFIVEYGGSLGDFWSADALGDTLIVEVTSDFSMTGYGFDIDEYEISE